MVGTLDLVVGHAAFAQRNSTVRADVAQGEGHAVAAPTEQDRLTKDGGPDQPSWRQGD